MFQILNKNIKKTLIIINIVTFQTALYQIAVKCQCNILETLNLGFHCIFKEKDV
jgi:hypothetical protein